MLNIDIKHECVTF